MCTKTKGEGKGTQDNKENNGKGKMESWRQNHVGAATVRSIYRRNSGAKGVLCFRQMTNERGQMGVEKKRRRREE